MSVFGHVIGDQADPDYDGSVLTAALNVGDLTLTVEDAADFDELAAAHGARLLIGVELDAAGHPDPATGTALAYTTCDDDTDTITLAATSLVAAAVGDRIYIENPVTGLPVGQLEVLVALDDGDTTGSALPAILDAALLAGVGDGISLTNQAIELDEDEDGQLVGVALPGLAQNPGAVKAMQDQLTVFAPGDQLLSLSFRPMLNSEHLYWNGVYQPGDQWSRDQWTVTIPDGAGVIEVGDVLAMEYLYTDPTPGNPIECRQVTAAPGGVSVHGPTGLPANPGSVVVGGGNQWADGSDATYGTETTGDTMGYGGTSILDAPLPTLAALGIDPATVKSVVLRCRVSASLNAISFVPFVADNDEASTVTVANFGDAFGPYTSDTPGAITDAVLPLKGSPLADLIAALSGPAPRLAFVTSSGTPDFTVYEASVELTVCKPASEWAA